VRVQRNDRRLSRNVRGSERAAQRVEHKLIASLENGTAQQPLRQTVAAYLENSWLPHIRLQRTSGTFARYRATAHTHVIPRSGRLPLEQVANLHIQQVLDDMLAAVQQRLLAFQTRYQQTAKPFKWTLTRTDLHRLLARLAAYEATAPLPAAAKHGAVNEIANGTT